MDRKFLGKTGAEWIAVSVIIVGSALALCCISWAFSAWVWPLGFVESLIVFALVICGCLFVARRRNHHGQAASSMPPSDSNQPFASSLGATREMQSLQDPTEEITVPPSPIIQQPQRQTPEIPPIYNRLLHWKYFVKEAVPFFGIGILSVVVVGVTLFAPKPSLYNAAVSGWSLLLAAVLLLVAVYGTVRASKTRTMRPLVCDPENGMLQIYQAGLLLLAMSDSSPDSYSLDDIKLITPGRSPLERIFFRNSQKLILEGSATTKKDLQEDIVLTDVIDVEHLLAIQRYRESTQEEMKYIARDQLAATNRQNELLEQFIRMQHPPPSDN